MAFTFEITHVSRFPRARIGVLDGKVLDGKVMLDSIVQLVHGERRLPLRIKGAVLGLPRPDLESLSLTVDLREPAMRFASEGGQLVLE